MIAKTISELCKMHRRTSYWYDGNGYIGVANHHNTISWYIWTIAGYSLTGSTNTLEAATKQKLESDEIVESKVKNYSPRIEESTPIDYLWLY